MAELSPVEIVALSKCVKDKEVTEARAKIPEASAHNYGFTVFVSGTLTRAGGSPAAIGVIAESTRAISLRSDDAFCALLRELKIGPKRLETALRAIAATPGVDDELLAVFQRVEADRAEIVPAREVSTPAKSGNISVNATVARV